MSGTAEKPSLNRSTDETRKTLFQALDGVLAIAHQKIHASGNSDGQKRGWARILVQAVSAYGVLLKDREIDELEERVKLLEEHKNENGGKENQKPGKLH